MRYSLSITFPGALASLSICTDNHFQVTIQIDTNPPKMENPTSLDEFAGPNDSEPRTVDINDLVNNMTRITKEFQIPAELLE